MRGVPRHLLSSVLRSSEKVCGGREKGWREAWATCWQDSGGKNKMKQAPQGSWCHVAQTGFYCWDNNKTYRTTHRHTHAHTIYYVKQMEVMTETLTHHALDNYIRLYVFTCMCACLCVHVCLSVFFVPMPSLVDVNPHLFSERQSGKPSTMQCPSNGLICIMDPHDVSSLALSLHSSPCSHII